MARKLKCTEALVCVGQTALRAPDGTPLDAVPMYIIVDRDLNGAEAETADALTPGELSQIDDICGILAKKFEAYKSSVGRNTGKEA